MKFLVGEEKNTHYIRILHQSLAPSLSQQDSYRETHMGILSNIYLHFNLQKILSTLRLQVSFKDAIPDCNLKIENRAGLPISRLVMYTQTCFNYRMLWGSLVDVNALCMTDDTNIPNMTLSAWYL